MGCVSGWNWDSAPSKAWAGAGNILAAPTQTVWRGTGWSQTSAPTQLHPWSSPTMLPHASKPLQYEYLPLSAHRGGGNQSLPPQWGKVRMGDISSGWTSANVFRDTTLRASLYPTAG